MDRATELSFGLDTVRRSAEFKLGKLARRTGLLSLAGWIKNGGKDRLIISVPPSGGVGIIIESIHSCDGEPPIPWDLVETRGEVSFISCAHAAYGQALWIKEGSLRVQVTPNPVVALRRGPNSPAIEVRLGTLREQVELRTQTDHATVLRPGRSPMIEGPTPVVPPKRLEWTRAQRNFVTEARKKAVETVTVFVPRWLGVSNSTRVLFEDTALYPMPADVTAVPMAINDAEVQLHTDVLIASGARRIILSGGDEPHYRLMLAVKARDPSIRFDMVFHGNFVQLQDPYVWSIFNLWINAARSGVLHTFVTVKKGAEEVFKAMGVRSEYLINYVPGPTMPPPTLDDSPHSVGIWTSGTIFKSVDPMLAALKLVPDAALHAAGIGEHGLALADCLELRRGFVSELPVSREELPARIRATHLSLYVTFAECSPMLPLESLQLGVPCLVGPSSHLFEDDRYLFDRLVVPFPDRPDVIARYAIQAIQERAEIIGAWSRYAVRYNAEARGRVQQFLNANTETPARLEEAPT